MNTLAKPTTDPTSGKPPRRRRWIPASLRMFLAMLATLGVGTVWIGFSIWLPYHREQQIVAEIRNCGGKVRFEASKSDCLPMLIGGERMKVFDRVTEVWCSNSSISDAEVLRFTGLKELKCLGLSRTAVSDTSLVHLSAMTKLESLYLDKTRISDTGLTHLGSLTTLRKLSVADTMVTDDGLAQLNRLNNLEVLWLKHTGVSDAGCITFNVALPDCRIER